MIPWKAVSRHGYGRDLPEPALIEVVREEAGMDDPVDRRALRIAELVRTHTGRRWVGIYRVDGDEVANLAWSGPAAPRHPRFRADRGLTGASIASRSSVVSNDVASDPRYLTALDSTRSEAIVPVLQGDEIIGTLDVEDERTGAFDRRHLGLLEQVADALATLY